MPATLKNDSPEKKQRQSLPSSLEKKGQKICLYGGTFDPVHQGHTAIAQKVQEQLQLDHLFFIPCCQSPHKMDRDALAAEHRLAMCDLALEELPWCSIDTYDLVTPPPNFSWKTAEHFAQRYPQAKLYWLMGTDQWNALHLWGKYDYLAEMLDFIIFTRGNEALERRPYTHYIVEGSHPANASAIRKHYQQKTTPHPWLNPKVAAYIQKHQLY